MASVTTIAKSRSQFIARVVQGFEALHGERVAGNRNIRNVIITAVNLPPTLSKSQVSSVRKSLKMQMLALLRQPAAYPLQTNITTLLTDLGATQSEVRGHQLQVNEL